MKRLILGLLMILSCTFLSAQVPTKKSTSAPVIFSVFDANFGDSELNGMLGIEFQISHFSISGGWRPGMTPSGQKINSWSTALSIYGNEKNIEGYIYFPYFSIGMSSQGYIHTNSTYPFLTGEYTVSPSVIALVGFKSFFIPELSKRLSIKVGFGCNVSEYGTMPSFEVLINFALFKTKN
jgi:hypothetical protein